VVRRRALITVALATRHSHRWRCDDRRREGRPVVSVRVFGCAPTTTAAVMIAGVNYVTLTQRPGVVVNPGLGSPNLLLLIGMIPV